MRYAKIYVVFMKYCKIFFFLFPKTRQGKISLPSRNQLLLIKSIFKKFVSICFLYDIPLNSVLVKVG